MATAVKYNPTGRDSNSLMPSPADRSDSPALRIGGRALPGTAALRLVL